MGDERVPGGVDEITRYELDAREEDEVIADSEDHNDNGEENGTEEAMKNEGGDQETKEEEDAKGEGGPRTQRKAKGRKRKYDPQDGKWVKMKGTATRRPTES